MRSRHLIETPTNGSGYQIDRKRRLRAPLPLVRIRQCRPGRRQHTPGRAECCRRLQKPSSTRILCHLFLLGAHRARLRCSGFPESSPRLSARASGSIPRRVSLGLVITKPIPTVAGDSIQIVHHNPIVNRQLAQKPAIAVHASAVGIDKTELALLDTLSVSPRSRTGREFSHHPSAPVVFTLEAAHPPSYVPVLPPDSAP